MVEPEMLLEILCTLHTRYQYTHISMFSMHTQWKRDFRALIFCRTPQEITLLSTNSTSRPLDTNDVARENSAVIAAVTGSKGETINHK